MNTTTLYGRASARSDFWHILSDDRRRAVCGTRIVTSRYHTNECPEQSCICSTCMTIAKRAQGAVARAPLTGE